jgi:hypothetical protein
MSATNPIRRRDPAPQLALILDPTLDAKRAALIAARAAGCTCAPDVEIRGIRATVRHDNWCALLRREDRN